MVFDFENVPPGEGSNLTLSAPAVSTDFPFVAADFRWTDSDGTYADFADHGVQLWHGDRWGWGGLFGSSDDQWFVGRGLGTNPEGTYYFLDLDADDDWVLTGFSLTVANDEGITNDVQVVAFQGGVETLIGTFDLREYSHNVELPITEFPFESGKAEIRLKPQGELGLGFYAVDDIHLDFYYFQEQCWGYC